MLYIHWIILFLPAGQVRGKRLLFELLKKLDAELKHEVCHWAAYYVRSYTRKIISEFYKEGVNPL
ncbi:unnamed protein product [Thlaspi arvense]|uniref:Transposase n=1 Tax=Thlaspi arvense TaxID=13288 RepID=A0AAU9SL38_THLAR|nr:unnamed protein product [Thlaspi arvense]